MSAWHRLLYPVFIAVLAFAIPSPAAWAGVASASLDWSNFNAFVIGIPGQATPTLSFDSKLTDLSATATSPARRYRNRNENSV